MEIREDRVRTVCDIVFAGTQADYVRTFLRSLDDRFPGTYDAGRAKFLVILKMGEQQAAKELRLRTSQMKTLLIYFKIPQRTPREIQRIKEQAHAQDETGPVTAEEMQSLLYGPALQAKGISDGTSVRLAFHPWFLRLRGAASGGRQFSVDRLVVVTSVAMRQVLGREPDASGMHDLIIYVKRQDPRAREQLGRELGLYSDDAGGEQSGERNTKYLMYATGVFDVPLSGRKGSGGGARYDADQDKFVDLASRLR